MFKLCLAARKAIKCGEITITWIGECSAVIPKFLFKRACQVPLRALYPARGKSSNTACCNSPTSQPPLAFPPRYYGFYQLVMYKTVSLKVTKVAIDHTPCSHKPGCLLNHIYPRPFIRSCPVERSRLNSFSQFWFVIILGYPHHDVRRKLCSFA